jgi:hypothetical protein
LYWQAGELCQHRSELSAVDLAVIDRRSAEALFPQFTGPNP